MHQRRNSLVFATREVASRQRLNTVDMHLPEDLRRWIDLVEDTRTASVQVMDVRYRGADAAVMHLPTTFTLDFAQPEECEGLKQAIISAIQTKTGFEPKSFGWRALDRSKLPTA